MGRLEGKSVIITGAGSGIGRAASLLFTKEGARLIAVDRAEGVKETVDAGAQGRRHGRGRDRRCRFGKGRHRLHRQGGLHLRAAGCDLGQCRHQRRAGAACRADRGTLAGDPAHQPDRPVPRDQAFDAAHDQTEIRRDRLHRIGRGPEDPAPAVIPMRRARPASSAWCRPPPIRCPAPACGSTRYVPA